MNHSQPLSGSPPPGGAPGGKPGGAPPGGSSFTPAMFAARQHMNELNTEYYAAALCGLIGVFIITHWARLLVAKRLIPTALSKALSPVSALSRYSRRVFIRKLPGFSSLGHAFLTSIYVGINLVCSFSGVDMSQSANFASRFGWMAAANFIFVVFLGLKNTPLAILTSYSYERLNPLHQIAGYTTIAYMILHASIYTAYFIGANKWYILHENMITAGIVLGFAMFASGVEALVLRRYQYELFYIFHIIMFIMMVVTLGFHLPELESKHIGIVACIAAGIWTLDRLIRLTRLFFNGINNEATIFPLPNGGTRILLRKPLHRAVPGCHCFVWLPKVRLLETHPFTIVATSPAELIVNSYSGFTRDLHKYAVSNPGASMQVSLEGPYGTFPNPTNYDRVILVAGGSGASFTFGLASNMLQGMGETTNKQMDFIWSVKHKENLSWFSEHLEAIRTHIHAPRVALRLHTTRAKPSENQAVTEKPSTQSLQPTITSQSSVDLSPMTPISEQEKEVQVMGARDFIEDPNKEEITAVVCHMGCRTATTGSINVPIEHGRPDTAALIQEAIQSVGKDEKVLVAACGPTGLIKVVRNTTASLIGKDGPSIELHCEQFGW